MGIWTSLVFAAACSGSSEGGQTSDVSDGAESDASTSTGTSGNTGATEDSASTGGSDEPNLGPCAEYIECVMAATPEMLTGAIATYGEEGACWQLPGVTEQDCWTECTALLENLQEAFPALCSAAGLTFEVDIKPILDTTCRPGCHEPGGYWPTFDMSEPDLYDRLVQMPSPTEGFGCNLVEPGDSSTSYLYLKVSGTHQGPPCSGVGVQMPASARDPTMSMPLPQAQIDTFMMWIDDGADP